MKRWPLAALVGALAVMLAVLSACGSTPAPCTPAPTQTPWIIIVTATPEPGEMTPPLQPTPTTEAAVAPTKAAATPTVQATKTATARQGITATPTQVQPQPTSTPTPTATHKPAAYKYPAPLLLEPPDGTSFAWRIEVLLEWQSVGALAEDEYYFVELQAFRESDGMLWHGDYVYVKDAFFSTPRPFIDTFHPPASDGPARVYWWVSVARKTGEDQFGKPVGIQISPPSEKRYFVVEGKPD
jgi:hypothetical protein